MSHCLNMRSHAVVQGFTLVELLVVIAIIVVLLALLAPALDKALDAGQRAVCGAHENGIFKGAKNFSFSNKGKVHRYRSSLYRWFTNDGGTAEEVSDTAGQQSTSQQNRNQIPSEDTRAYWGVLYAEWGAQRNMFNCPAAERCDLNMIRTNADKGVDQDGDWGDAPANSTPEQAWEAGGKWTNYGFNGRRAVYFQGKVYNGATGDGEIDKQTSIGTDTADGSYYDGDDTYGREPARKWTQIKNPGRTIFFHDAMETMLEGGSDTLANIYEWHFLNPYPDDPQGYLEWFRHSNGSMVIWGDGHVSYEQATEDLDKTFYPFGPERVGQVSEWYTGNSTYQDTQAPGTSVPESPL